MAPVDEVCGIWVWFWCVHWYLSPSSVGFSRRGFGRQPAALLVRGAALWGDIAGNFPPISLESSLIFWADTSLSLWADTSLSLDNFSAC